MTISNNYNTYRSDLTTNNYVQLYNYLLFAVKSKYFSLNTADIIYINNNNTCKNIEQMYFIFNQSLLDTNKIQLSLFLYPKFALNKGYKLTNFLVENFIQNNNIQRHKVKIEFKKGYIKLNSEYIDILDISCPNENSFNCFLGFKAAIDSYLNIVKLLLSFVSDDVKINIELNLSKINHLDLIHKIDESRTTLKPTPKALDRVLYKSQITTTLDTPLYNRHKSCDRMISPAKLFKAKDIIVKKDNKIPNSLKRVLNYE